MAEALARGFDAAGIVNFAEMMIIDTRTSRFGVFVCPPLQVGAGPRANLPNILQFSTFNLDRNEARVSTFQQLGFAVKHTYKDALDSHIDVIFIGVKPHAVAGVMADLGAALSQLGLTSLPLLVSIAAGITTMTMEQAAGGVHVPIMRVMPNTPCLVACLAGAMSKGKWATPEHVAVTGRLVGSVGKCHESGLWTVGLAFQVPESNMDAVTAVSGSGPAYLYLVIEAMADGGVLAGLPRAVAQDLAARTVMGAAKMVLETGKHPGELKDAVTSPAGTTIVAVKHLEQCGIRAAFQGAVKAAADRGHELSRQ
eukprot:gene10907-1982_t